MVLLKKFSSGICGAVIEDQEFVASSSTRNYYWEGDCKVGGSAAGRAYVELTGYAGRMGGRV